ncbi:hypothetical protein [Geomonas oryzae]|uniref:hypothetical protein n=1 Tax=Geomonas oryzae TaxID=2364273 RepID=UPI001FE847E9|nr:hypothetical protein [Geomonas oryzae]
MPAAVAVLLLAALPAFAADKPAPVYGDMPQMKDAVPGSPGYIMKGPMRREMTRTPEHLLMMAYHRNVANFAQLLYAAADAGAPVAPQLARVAVAEMRRSVEEMEKYRAGMQLPPQRQKMMEQHLIDVKMHLRALEDLVRADRIDAAQVKSHLEPLVAGYRQGGCGLMPGRSAQGMGPRGGAPGMRGMMMERMLDKAKEQDEDLEELLQELDQAPADKKLDLVVETVKRMAQQRAEMTEEMERNHEEMMRMLQPGAPPMQGSDDEGDGGGEEDED